MRLCYRVGLITTVILFTTVIFLFRLDSAGEVSSQQLSIIYELMPLSKYDLVHDSELIVIGSVLDRNSAGKDGEIRAGAPENITRIPGIRNIIEVEKDIKGAYGRKTIDVVSEGDLSGKIVVEGPPKFNRGEKAVLFLYREKGYGGRYTTMGMHQGMFPVDSNGLIQTKFMPDSEYWPLNSTSLADFEDNIKEILSKPKPEKSHQDMAPGDRDLTTEEVRALERNTTSGFVE